jgi:hypothetical protein
VYRSGSLPGKLLGKDMIYFSEMMCEISAEASNAMLSVGYRIPSSAKLK